MALAFQNLALQLGSERDAATTESESAAKSFEHKIEQLKYQNERLVRELVALRHKFSQSLEVLKAYQGRMLDMETQLKAQQENLDESSSRSRPALSVCQPVAIAAVRAVPFKRLPALSMAVEANVHVPPVTVAEPPSRDVFSASSSESQAFTSIMPQLPRAGGTAAEVERTLDAQRDEDNSDLLYSFVTESSDGDESREDAVLPSRAPLTRGADVWSSPPRPGAVMSAHQQWLSASEFERHQELLHSPSRSRSIDRSDTSEHRSSSGGSDDSDGDAAWSDPARLTSYMHARRQPTIEESEPLDPSEGSISLGCALLLLLVCSQVQTPIYSIDVCCL